MRTKDKMTLRQIRAYEKKRQEDANERSRKSRDKFKDPLHKILNAMTKAERDEAEAEARKLLYG